MCYRRTNFILKTFVEQLSLRFFHVGPYVQNETETNNKHLF